MTASYPSWVPYVVGNALGGPILGTIGSWWYGPDVLNAAVNPTIEHLEAVYQRGLTGSSNAELRETLRWGMERVDVDEELVEGWIDEAGENPALLLAAVHKLLVLARARRTTFLDEARSWREWFQEWQAWSLAWAPYLIVGAITSTFIVGAGVAGLMGLGALGGLGGSALGGSTLAAGATGLALSEAVRRSAS